MCNLTNKVLIRSYPSPKYPHQINYYSGSKTVDEDGDKTGNKNHDNVRMLNTNRFVYASLGDESQPCQEETANDIDNNQSEFDVDGNGNGKSSSSSQSNSRVVVNVPPPIPTTVNGNVTNVNFYGNISVTVVAKLDEEDELALHPMGR